jgi:hypothetical protein
VDGRSIIDDDQPARDLTQQMVHQGKHVFCMQGAVLTVEVHLAFQRNRAHGGERIAGPPLPSDGRLAHWGRGAHDRGQRIKSGLVYEEKRWLWFLRPLLIAGQVSSRHCAIAAASRLRARREGFCGLHRSALPKRPTWRE